VEVYLGHEVSPTSFAWAVPIGPDRVRIGVTARTNAALYLKRLLAAPNIRDRIQEGEPKYTRRVIPLGPLKKSYAQRLMVIGDAAGQVKPTTGGGIYYGLLCADIAAEVVGRALQADDLSRRRLAEYDRRWKKALQNEIRLGYLSRLVFERLSDSSIDELFDVVQAHALDKMALNLDGFSFDWHGGILSKALSHPGVRGVLGVALKGLLSGKAEVALA